MLLQSSLLKSLPGLVHWFSTRQLLGDDGKRPADYRDHRENILSSKNQFVSRFGIPLDQISSMAQTHSDHISIIVSPSYPEDTDALVTETTGNFLIVQCADCVPIFLAHPSGVAAIVHSGRRGTMNNISRKTVELMAQKYSISPAEIVARVGPSICQQHYEVGEDVAEHFDPRYCIPSSHPGKHLLSLQQCITDELMSAGVQQQNIEVSPYCTYEHPELLYSCRRQGKGFGRNFGLIGFR